MDFKVGDRVNRIEDREIRGATIIELCNMDSEFPSALIAYDEGGEGYWPLDCLELIV